MIIRHMQGTFGTLDGEQLRLDTGLNIIYAPNESGKSTWCAFLRAMLYGIDTSQRARAGFVPDKQKYAPWSGKPMAGELELEQDGKRITIRRWTEAKSAPMRAFSAVYTGTDIPVPGLTATDAGEQSVSSSAMGPAARWMRTRSAVTDSRRAVKISNASALSRSPAVKISCSRFLSSSVM